MPVYEYTCPVCFAHAERIKPVDRCAEEEPCFFCDATMKRVLSPVVIHMGPVGAYGYYDETLEKYIHTNQQRRDEMDRQGVTEYGSTPKNGSAWV